MKVTCCRCGKTYEYDYGTGVIKETIDLKNGNVCHIIECPHCGLRHYIGWFKWAPWKEVKSVE